MASAVGTMEESPNPTCSVSRPLAGRRPGAIRFGASTAGGDLFPRPGQTGRPPALSRPLQQKSLPSAPSTSPPVPNFPRHEESCLPQRLLLPGLSALSFSPSPSHSRHPHLAVGPSASSPPQANCASPLPCLSLNNNHIFDKHYRRVLSGASLAFATRTVGAATAPAMAQPREPAFQHSSPDSSKGGADSYNNEGTPDTRLTAFSPQESSAKSSKLAKAAGGEDVPSVPQGTLAAECNLAGYFGSHIGIDYGC